MKAGEWTLRSRRVVTPSGTRAADVLIRSESIAAVEDHDGPDSEGVILDVGDLVVLPGLVALHRAGPARPDGPWYERATRDAGAGGVTTLVDLPRDDDPESNSPSAFRARMAAAEGKIRVDCGLVVGLGRGNADLLESWIESGVIGVEAFLGASGPGTAGCSTEADLRAAMPTLARLDRPLLVQSGRPDRTRSRAAGPDRAGPSPTDREIEALRLLIQLCRESRCRVHLIQPLATEALPMIARARDEGLPLTVETCPGHLDTEEVANCGPSDSLTPSARRTPVRDRPWEGPRKGSIDAIGVASPRDALPAAWAGTRRRGGTPDDLARWMAGKPAEALGLARRKGSIAPGLDADLVVFDPDAPPIDDLDDHRPRRHASPDLDARSLTGRVEATILRGSLIYQGGRFHDDPKGSVVLRLEETIPLHGATS